MPTLTGPRAAPRSGQTKSLVIFLHGYGADGNDLFGLSGQFAEHMPDSGRGSINVEGGFDLHGGPPSPQRSRPSFSTTPPYLYN